MGKVEENKQQKEQRLLDTAFALFTTKGVVKTSISDIVERAGLGKGTFYLYFKDKYDIQEQLIVRKARQVFHHALENAGESTGKCFADSLIAVVDDILEQFQQDTTLLRFINKNLSWGIFRRAIDRSSEDYMEPIRKALSESGDRIPNLDMLIYTIVELVGSTAYSVILEHDPVSLAEYKPHLYRSIRAVVESFREPQN